MTIPTKDKNENDLKILLGENNFQESEAQTPHAIALAKLHPFHEHLYMVDAEAKETVRRLTAEFAKARGIDEKLKATDSLRWVQEMNNCKACAEEVVMESICG